MRAKTKGLLSGLALAIAVGAITAPTAFAVPVDQYLPGSAGGATEEESAARQKESSYSSVNALVPPVPSPTQAAAPVSAPSTVAADGFDWGDAGLGAASMFALLAIAAGAMLAVGQRPRSGQKIA